jgi:hypothetical protein
MSNYPDGMTASDWAHVNGPDYEIEREEQRDVEHECARGIYFEGEVTALVTDSGPYYMVRVDWTCPQCGTSVREDEDWKED